jgi:hypothetical protein
VGVLPVGIKALSPTPEPVAVIVQVTAASAGRA